jgi:hypothetical protein
MAQAGRLPARDSSRDETEEHQGWWPLLRRIGFALGFGALAGMLILSALELARRPDAPRRQLAAVTLLPDPTPPPQARTQRQEQRTEMPSLPEPSVPPPPPQSVAPDPPAQAPIAAAPGSGDLPAGEDSDGVSIGGTGSGGGPEYAAYARRLEQVVESDLARRRLKAAHATIYLWLGSDGAIQRYLIRGQDPGNGSALRTAIAELGHVEEHPPAGMPMPVGLEISVR